MQRKEWVGWLSRYSDWLRAGRSGDRIPVGRDFLPFQTGPAAHPASCTIGTGSFPRVKYGRGVLLTTQPLLVSRSWKSRAIPLPTLWVTNGSVMGTLYLLCKEKKQCHRLYVHSWSYVQNSYMFRCLFRFFSLHTSNILTKQNVAYGMTFLNVCNVKHSSRTCLEVTRVIVTVVTLVNDQLDPQFFYFIIPLLQSSTCFEQRCAHHQEVKFY